MIEYRFRGLGFRVPAAYKTLGESGGDVQCLPSLLCCPRKIP